MPAYSFFKELRCYSDLKYPFRIHLFLKDVLQPGLPLTIGHCKTQTHDYKRNGTTTLFAALTILDGRVIGDCMPRHRHQEFVRFLKKIDVEMAAGLDLHLIVDNYDAHKHPGVKSWLQRHPRFHIHFTQLPVLG